MLGFLKIFAQGVLYVVLLPFILLILALYAIYCVFVFIYIAIRSVIVFFMGGTPLGDLPEDVEAKRILMEREAAKQENTTQSLADAIVQSQMQIAQSLYQQQQAQQPVQENANLNEPTFETSNDVEEETYDVGEEDKDDFTY